MVSLLPIGNKTREPIIPYHLHPLYGASSKSNVGLLCSLGDFCISNLIFADDCLIFARDSSLAGRNVNC